MLPDCHLFTLVLVQENISSHLNGIELVLSTCVKAADVRRKTLLTAAGETISYKTLIIATGARALKLEEFGVTGADAGNICYLRDLNDAVKLVEVMSSCIGSKAVVIGGGYIGMECTAALVTNKIHVTMVFPEPHCMARLFTPEIASFYEDYYKRKGVLFIKGTVMASFESDSKGKVAAVNLKDGTQLEADMVVVGVGIRANTSLFEGQLTLEKGGIKVNGKMQSSNSSVYAVGDVAAFPLKLYGDTRRLEHVDNARKSAAHAVQAIMVPEKCQDYDYLPFFYSRVFTLSWQFYGNNVGDCILFGNPCMGKLGAFWVDRGQLVGAFLEGGSKDEYMALARAARLKPSVKDKAMLASQGLSFVLSLKDFPTTSFLGSVAERHRMMLDRPLLFPLHGSAGVAVALGIMLMGYWYSRRRRRW